MMLSFLRSQRFLWACVTAGGAVLLQAGAASATVMVSDDFESYADTTALRAAWTKGGGSDVNLTTNFDVDANIGIDQAISKSASLGNGIWYRSFATISGDWTLSAKMLMSTYSRSQGIGLLDSTGKQGYMLRWNSGNVNQYGGNGSISIRKFDLASEWTDYSYLTNNTFTSDLTGGAPASVVNSTHAATGYAVTAAPDNTIANATFSTTWDDFADVEIAFTAATNTLVVKVNNSTVLTIADAGGFTNFSRLYIRGNSTGYFDNVSLDAVVPEPASLGLLGLGLLAVARRRRTA